MRAATLIIGALHCAPSSSICRHAATPASSETKALDYIRAELQILNSILGELVPDFWKIPSINGNKKGAPEYHPSIVNTPSTNSRKWPLSGY